MTGTKNISKDITNKNSRATTRFKFPKAEKTAAGAKNNNKKGVVYLGHLPNGFYEAEIKKYFGQFGKVRRLRISRSAKSGKSKGYAFVQFADEDVARIAAESSNNYMMFKKNLQAELVDPEKVHDNLFKDCYKKFKPRREPLRRKRVYNSVAVGSNATEKKKRKKSAEKQKFLESMGYKLEPVVSGSEDSVPSTHNTGEPASSTAALTKKTTPKADTAKRKKSVSISDAAAVIDTTHVQEDSDDEVSFKMPANVILKKEEVPKQGKRKYPKTPIPDKKTVSRVDSSPTDKQASLKPLGVTSQKASTEQSNSARSTKKSAEKKKKTPSLEEKVAKTTESPKTSATSEQPAADASTKSTQSVKSKQVTSDASPELTTRTPKSNQKTKSNTPSTSTQVTPQKKASQYSPRVTRSAVKKRKSVI